MRGVKFLISILLLIQVAANAQTGPYVQPLPYRHYSLPFYINIGNGILKKTDTSAYLELGPFNGGSKGFLPPRLTTSERNNIPQPKHGLQIFNRTNLRPEWYDSIATSWKPFGSTYNARTPLIIENDTIKVNGLSGYGSSGQMIRSTGSALEYFSPSYVTTRDRFGLSGEDETATVNRSFNVGGYNFTISNSGQIEIISTEGGNVVIGGLNRSTITVGDNILIYPHLGSLIIDTLNAFGDTINWKPLVYRQSTGEVKKATYWPGGGGATAPSGNYGNGVVIRNGALATPASDSLDFDGGLSIKGTLKATSLASGANTDSVVTVNTSTNLFNKKRATVINIASRDSGDIIQWNGTENVYVPKPTAATNLIGNIRFRIGDTNAPSSGDSLLTNTGLINKFLFVWRNGKLLDSNSTNGYTFTRSTGVVKFKPVFASADTINIQAYDTTSVYRIALETIVLPSVDLDLAENRSNLTKTGTVFTPTANNTTFDAYGQDALKIPSGQSGRFYSQYVTSGDNTYMLFVNTSSSFLPYANANSHGLYVNGSNQIQPLNSGTPGSSVGSVTAGSWYGIYRDIGAGNIRIQSSTDGVSWTDVATLSAYSSADLYLSIVIYSTSGKKVSNPKGQGVL